MASSIFPRRPAPALALAIAAALALSPAAQALTFNFTYGPGVTPDIINASVAAGNLWSGYFNDPVTLNITINYNLAGTAVGDSAQAFIPNPSYSTVRTALIGDALSPDDFSSSAALQFGPNATMAINRLGGSLRIDSAGSSQINNTEVLLERTVAKAIGLLAGNDAGVDGSVNLNPTLSYDANRNDGIAGGSYDLIGVIAHELGHVLGFQSAAELVSVLGGVLTEATVRPRVADFFRFSSYSITDGGAGVFDIAADNREKYFSVDGGTTAIAQFARGSNVSFGNGQQANHWLDSTPNPPIGLLDPTIAQGELLGFTAADLRFFDVIGYNAIPEPSTWAAGIALLGGLGTVCWRRRRAGN